MKLIQEVYGTDIVVKTSDWLPPKGYFAINLYPFAIYVRAENFHKLPESLLRHETIHTLQAKSLLIIPYYLWYLIEYLIKLLITLSTDRAYRSICFEQEAYKNENNLNYDKERKFMPFLKYVFKLTPKPIKRL